ncbi:recombinase family protein [Peptoniphilus vaginalis]|uniref:recombinase family protein n=1 Tax=Peptoniphilus vaginalis TaxID=1756987 RepID=UPI000A26D1D2|nr:recombinase family protein [Peptoniphilus vaginalis]
MAKITKIKNQNLKLNAKIKVAAYARVSEATDMTHKSLSAQVNNYKKLIKSNPEWDYAGVYADEGITGRTTKNRAEFNRLLEDCKAGKINMVLVKSISRFARDTVDCLNTVRELKDLNIAVYFERERINSLTSEGELLLTLLASFAQEESRSISENVKWGIKKNFEQGIENGHIAPYGYYWDGEKYRIIPFEGKVVKEIYERYLKGESAYAIAKDLGNRGIVGRQGRQLEQTTVKDILSSISYTGDMILQKNYIDESKVRKRNKGELPMYLVENMYEPLVSKEDYQKALNIRRERAEKMPNKNPILTPYSGLVKCGNCGSGISRRTAGNKKKWVCNTKERKGLDCCDSRPIKEEELIKASDEVIGLSGYSNEEFKDRIKEIKIFGDRLEFKLKNGKIKVIERTYTGERGSNPFTNKIYCKQCGSKCIRHNNGKSKAWFCTNRDFKPLSEEELKKAAFKILGSNFQGKVVEHIKIINISKNKLEFLFKNGDEKIWQRE